MPRSPRTTPTRDAVAVVTIAHGRHDHLARQQRSLGAGDRSPAPWVVVAMGDSWLETWTGDVGPVPEVVAVDADPGRLPLAAARNRGAARALEQGADVLVFLDVDCLAGPTLLQGYAAAVRAHPGTVWSGPVTYLPPGLDEATLADPSALDDPHPARPAPAPGELVHGAPPELFWSLSFALSGEAWERSGGFHEGYAGYGGEDTDFARTLADRGLDLGWVGDARAYHQHHPVQSPPVDHLDDILRNGALFARRWGSWPMGGWLERFEELGLVERTPSGWSRRPG